MVRKINFALPMENQLLMRRCIQLAKLGQGTVAPNPIVGALILHNNKVISEGWHRVFGMAHAEVEAINNVKDESLLSTATLFVNLEPCCHEGKTPPCVNYIIRKKIRKVVIGIMDPYAEVNGKGIRILKEAGVEVITGICEKECKDLNRRFIIFHLKKRPYIILKWAQSGDGFIGRENETVSISNPLAKMMVHKWRAREAAVMTGTNTILTDDPQLNVRNWFGRNPLRITIDKNGIIPAGAKILDGSQQTLVFTFKDQTNSHNLEYDQLSQEGNFLYQIMNRLYDRNIQSVLVEGGAVLLNSLIAADLFDEVRVFISPNQLHHGIKAPDLPFTNYNEIMVDDNRLLIYKKYQS